MQTRTYADLYSLIEALCGVSFASNERARIKSLVNRRASKAYKKCLYWPRFLKTAEERAVDENGYVPFEETGLDTIDTFLTIFKTQPFVTNSPTEYPFMVDADGAKLIAGSSDPDSVWVTYRIANTDIYGDGSTDNANVPKEWFEYLAHGAYADFLRAEGQQEKAALADAEAEDILTDELLNVDEQRTHQYAFSRISTNAGMQSR